jgi:alkanesulfonate monooxygenase SsuD/methylene tetrahydromethanopterin reductase-like flavin-dependent oxidoreductase (luciferase family)
MTGAQRYDQLWREIRLCDELGFDYAFSVEHHFRPDESWMPSPNAYVIGAGVQTQRIRLGAMGYVVPLHHPVRLAEEIILADQILHGRLEVGLVPGIVKSYFGPYGVDYEPRRAVTLEFVDFLRRACAATEPFDFEGRYHKVSNLLMCTPPVQRPHPPLWIESRDPPTLEFCAREGINTGYFFLFSRRTARERYNRYLEQWRAAGWPRKPNIAYSTAVYVDETDAKAIDRGLQQAGRAYRGFVGEAASEAELKTLLARHAEKFFERGEPEAAETVMHLNDPEWLLENGLVLVGSPETVAARLRDWSQEGIFNTFFGEFNFGSLPEEDLMRSLRLFGTEVMPRLREFEPF